jgi:hypothetical protein
MTTHEGIWIYFWVNWGAKVMVTSNAFEGLELIKILSRFSVVLHKNAGYWTGSNCG